MEISDEEPESPAGEEVVSDISIVLPEKSDNAKT
jgi:hypothetical protein